MPIARIEPGEFVCLAHAGMSPLSRIAGEEGVGLPRTRGDEPSWSVARVVGLGSAPHTRG